MVQRKAGPQYMRLAQVLLGEIRDGLYPPGSLLPTEAELCQQFGVSRITVRGALKELASQGMVSRRAGVGTRVESAAPRGNFVNVGTTVDELLRFTRGLCFHTLDVADVIVDAELHALLELPLGQRFVRVRGLRKAKGVPPVVYSEHHVPAFHADLVAGMDGVRFSLAEYLAEKQGDWIGEIHQAVDAVRLNESQAKLLQAEAGSPTLRTRTRYFGANKALLLASVTLFPEGRHLFTTVMRREPPA